MAENNMELFDDLSRCLEKNDKSSDCDHIIEGTDWEMFNHGAFRLVYSNDDYVVKVSHPRAHPSDVVDHNMTEVSVWNEAQEEGVSDHFAPIVDRDDEGKWIMMERVDTDVSTEDVLELKESLYGEHGWTCQDLVWNEVQKDQENFGSNIGTIDGRPVVFDYGEGCRH